MTNILNLGFKSRTMIQSNNFKIQKFDKDITDIFYPAMINLIAENNEAKEAKEAKEKEDKIKSPTESDSSNKKATTQSEYLSEDVVEVIKKSDIALKVFIYYIFNCLENVDYAALGSALKVVKNNHDRFGEDFLQTFSTILSKIIVVSEVIIIYIYIIKTLIYIYINLL